MQILWNPDSRQMELGIDKKPYVFGKKFEIW